MIDLFGGKRLSELELDDVRALLAQTGAQPLHWEAKGIKIEPGAMRKHICGFANSHDGGFLILGTAHRKGAWVLDGVELGGNDPARWVADVAAGVHPYPDGLETRAMIVGAARWIAVVWVPPTPARPCNADGTVYERVSGKTIAVRDPGRLAGLFAEGDGARQHAQAKARLAATRIMRLGRSHAAYEIAHVQFALGYAATGHQSDPSERLFSGRFEQRAVASIRAVLCDDGRQATNAPIVAASVTQDSRSFEVVAADLGIGSSWLVGATRDGAIGVYWTQGVECLPLETIVHGALQYAWQAAEEIVSMLSPQGPRYLQVIVAGGLFPCNRASLEPFDGSPRQPPVVARGPVERRSSSTVLASVERELRRAAGEMAYEEDTRWS